MPILIEPIKDDDILSYRRAVGFVAAERKYLARTTLQGDVSTSRAWIKSVLDGPGCLYVAKDTSQPLGEQVIGWANVSRFPSDLSSHVGILGMGLLAPYRGMGLGRRLLSAVLNRSRELGMEKIELQVHADNTPAISLYKRLGFELEGRLRRHRKDEQEYSDVLAMGLFL